MPHYEYRARNTAGESIEGTVQAATVSQAVHELEAQGLTILTIGEVNLAPASLAGRTAATPSRARDAEALELLLTPAIQKRNALLPALRAMATEQPATIHRRKLTAFIKILESGELPAAVASFDRLAEYWIPLIGASSTHDAAAAFQRFFKEWRDAHQLNLQSRLALSYAFIVLSAAAVVMTGVCVFIVPTFANVFAGFGLRTPGLTRVVVSLSEWVVTGRILGGIVGAALLFAVLWIVLHYLPRSFTAAIGDRFGNLFGRSVALARFTGYAADLLEAKSHPSLAIHLAAVASRSPRLERAARRWQTRASGAQAAPAVVWPVLPSTVAYALEPGIADATRIALLRELSQAYGERALARTSWTRGIVEPLAILFIGANVGVVVLALFLPLISLIQGLS
jgi:type II secretory pathway component PulF